MTEETKAPTDPFQLDLHAWIETQQTGHGVRHDDYAQYHAYCTRRLSRLSHHPDAKKYLVCSSKFAQDKSTAKGKGRHAFCSRQNDTFQKNPETNQWEVPHSSILWYLLVLSERSWAHACLLQKQKKKRQHVLRKLKKAQGWALQLVEMAKDHTDAVTFQECQAYASWMIANFALENLDYQVSIY
jgi:signal recognition particle subunit SRP68